MADNLLSPEELAALAEGVSDGSIAVDTGFNTAAKVKRHDLAAEDSSLGINLGSIDMINERFLRMFRPSLVESLRTSPKIFPTKTTVMKFGDYLADLKAPLSINVMRMNPLRGVNCIVIDPSVIFSSLDSFFGGYGKGDLGLLLPGRMFTPMEERIINLILNSAFKTLTEAWAPVLPIECELIGQEINPQFAQIADQEDLIILSRFETETITKNKGFIDIVYPYVSLKPIRESLRSRVQSGNGNEDADIVWHNELEAAVGNASLDTRVVLGKIQTTISAVESMKPGDLFHFKKPDFACMEPNGIPAFDVSVGSVGANVAVQIEQSITPGNN